MKTSPTKTPALASVAAASTPAANADEAARKAAERSAKLSEAGRKGQATLAAKALAKAQGQGDPSPAPDLDPSQTPANSQPKAGEKSFWQACKDEIEAFWK